MSDFDHIKALQSDVMELMRERGKLGRGNSVLYADALKLIQGANKSRLAKDLVKAYDVVLELMHDFERDELESIRIFLDSMARYTVTLIPQEFMYAVHPKERLIYALAPVDMSDDFMQHYLNHWRLHGCYMTTPDKPVFWQAWYAIYILAERYHVPNVCLYVKRLFTAYGEDMTWVINEFEKAG